ncbi:15-hydroxyprostaglandin dehydrogenase [Trichodelitschia bisporula]|uniref:15-hydroxyprostaglandin dehydrogenase n=1 Tax=Trichodelitschia bisporula TaxID=703511 RepID=A0A6G1HLN8_9PEZI|nr:15-hydroxyprostaglandin dehydrogenase [Trichodelitschia bisporula]
MSTQKAAIITGGGLDVARALAARGNWHVHIGSLSETAGTEAATSIGVAATSHCVDVTSYDQLAALFSAMHAAHGRLDFVFANAGVIDKTNFYEKVESLPPPPPPDGLSIEVNLRGVVGTVWLELHYMRAVRKGRGEQSVCVTSSCGGLYPTGFCPVYTGAKHGSVGFMRAVAKPFWVYDKIRVNAICPGTVRTGLMDEKSWDSFEGDLLTPVEKVREAVLQLLDGGDMVDAKGVRVSKDEVWGCAVEVNADKHYFREQPEFCNEIMETVMRNTDVTESANLVRGGS